MGLLLTSVDYTCFALFASCLLVGLTLLSLCEPFAYSLTSRRTDPCTSSTAGDVPALVLTPLTYSTTLPKSAKAININDKIMRLYLESILPKITADGSDMNYGSTAVLDVMCLQALSKRIHYGKFVAEAKFRCALLLNCHSFTCKILYWNLVLCSRLFLNHFTLTSGT